MPRSGFPGFCSLSGDFKGFQSKGKRSAYLLRNSLMHVIKRQQNKDAMLLKPGRGSMLKSHRVHVRTSRGRSLTPAFAHFSFHPDVAEIAKRGTRRLGTFNDSVEINPFDLYTPRVTRGRGVAKEGLCPIWWVVESCRVSRL